MDWISEIANWTGWLPIAAVLGLIIYFGDKFKNNRIEGLKEDIDRLKRNLEDCRSYRPDVVAERLAKSHKRAMEAISELESEKNRDTEKINELQLDLEKTKKEAEEYSIYLQMSQQLLGNLMIPRAGEINLFVLDNIYRDIRNYGGIFINVELTKEYIENDYSELRKVKEFYLELVYPGMFKEYFVLYDVHDNQIGRISNPHIIIYDRDYKQSLLEYLKVISIRKVEMDPSGRRGEIFYFCDIEYVGHSPKDNRFAFMKIPFEIENTSGILKKYKKDDNPTIFG